MKIIELRNELESLIYDKQNFLESNDAKEYTKNSEYSYLDKLISETKDWFEDEGSYTRNISLLSDKIELIKNEFGKVDHRISVKKKIGVNEVMDYIIGHIIEKLKVINQKEDTPKINEKHPSIFYRLSAMSQKEREEYIKSGNCCNIPQNDNKDKKF